MLKKFKRFFRNRQDFIHKWFHENRPEIDDILAFNEGDARIMISTEAGGEGLNLQEACHVMNYDLPCNPARLVQRIGRLYRYGQTKRVQPNFSQRWF